MSIIASPRTRLAALAVAAAALSPLPLWAGGLPSNIAAGTIAGSGGFPLLRPGIDASISGSGGFPVLRANVDAGVIVGNGGYVQIYRPGPLDAGKPMGITVKP